MSVEKPGLRNMVYFHRLTGNTYLAWNFNKLLSIKMKILLYLSNIILICICLYFACYTPHKHIEYLKQKYSQDKKAKSKLPYILDLLTSMGFILSTIFCLIFNIFRGKTILIFLYDQDINIDVKIERRISTKIIIVQLIVCLFGELGYSLAGFYMFGPNHLWYWHYLANYILRVFNKNIHFVLFSMIAYQCYVIEQRFNEITANFRSIDQFKTLSKEIFKIINLVKSFNKLINLYLFAVILFYFFVSINNFTVVYFDHGRSMLSSTVGTVETLIIMFIICITCDKLEKAYSNFLDKFEMLHEQNFDQAQYAIDYCMINRLYLLRDDICLTAFNLYKINTKTFMSIITFIITFAVILTQIEL